MEDRFKFRVWDKENKCLHYPTRYNNFAIVNGTVVKIESYPTANSAYLGKRIAWEFDDAVIMQSTGLKDKNGSLIYEGDIVKITREDWRKDLYSLVYAVCWDRTQWQLGLLKWQRPKAQANRRSDRTFPFKNIVSFDDYTPKKFFAQCEIIGNVYENEELLYNETQF